MVSNWAAQNVAHEAFFSAFFFFSAVSLCPFFEWRPLWSWSLKAPLRPSKLYVPFLSRSWRKSLRSSTSNCYLLSDLWELSQLFHIPTFTRCGQLLLLLSLAYVPHAVEKKFFRDCIKHESVKMFLRLLHFSQVHSEVEAKEIPPAQTDKTSEEFGAFRCISLSESLGPFLFLF